MKINIGGRVVEAEQIDFEPMKEEWNEYSLSDGNVLRLKIIVTSIFRTEEKDPITGFPLYFVQSNNVVTGYMPAPKPQK